MKLAKAAGEAEPAAADWAADNWAALVAKCAKSNFSFSDEALPGSKLPLLVSEGLSSLLVGLFGGECLATAEKAEFPFWNCSLDFDNCSR